MMTTNKFYLPYLYCITQGLAKERELNLVRKVPTGPIDCAFDAMSMWIVRGKKFKQGTFLLHEPVHLFG